MRKKNVVHKQLSLDEILELDYNSDEAVFDIIKDLAIIVKKQHVRIAELESAVNKIDSSHIVYNY